MYEIGGGKFWKKFIAELHKRSKFSICRNSFTKLSTFFRPQHAIIFQNLFGHSPPLSKSTSQPTQLTARFTDPPSPPI
jgi:hypothetical protein